MDVRFRELIQLSSVEFARATRDCVNEIAERFRTRTEPTGGLLAQVFLAAMALVARQRYGDFAVRALLTSMPFGTVGASKRTPSSALSPIMHFEKIFLCGDSERNGIQLMAERVAAELTHPSILSPKPIPIQNNVDRLVWLIFGETEPAPIQELGALLSLRMSEHVTGLKLLFSEHVVPRLAERTPSPSDPLPTAAPLRIACPIPAPAIEGPLSWAYRIHCEVEPHPAAAAPSLDTSAEVHVAPEGAPQAVERVYIHLRHRWYPAAFAVTVHRIEVLPPSALPHLSRRFSVVVDSGHESFSSLAIGRTIDEAWASLEGGRPSPNATLRERPLCVSGRKARPPLHLDRFLNDVEAAERDSS
jgi:hypothetical protein